MSLDDTADLPDEASPTAHPLQSSRETAVVSKWECTEPVRKRRRLNEQIKDVDDNGKNDVPNATVSSIYSNWKPLLTHIKIQNVMNRQQAEPMIRQSPSPRDIVQFVMSKSIHPTLRQKRLLKPGITMASMRSTHSELPEKPSTKQVPVAIEADDASVEILRESHDLRYSKETTSSSIRSNNVFSATSSNLPPLEKLRRHSFLDLSGFSLPCIHPDCNQQFAFTQRLYQHIKYAHGPEKRCPYCKWVASSYVKLVRHALAHTKHKPYVCPFSDCEYAAAQKGALKQHLMSSFHDYEMPAELLKQIMSSDRLTTPNLQTVHQSSLSPDTMPSATDVITQNTNTSKNNYDVRKHGLAFSGFVFSCIYPKCQRRFRLTESLYNHIRSHEAPQKECPYCGKKMLSVGQLVAHVRTHTRRYPYFCPFWHCDYCAAQKSGLKTHLESATHRNEMSPRLLDHIMSWDSTIYNADIRMTMASWQRNKTAASSRNVMPFRMSSDNQSASNRRELVKPELEKDSEPSTKSSSMDNPSVTQEITKIEDKELLHEIIEISPEMTIINQNKNVATDRIQQLELEIGALKAALYRAQTRINVLETACNQKTILGNASAQTIQTLNKRSTAANVQINILNQRLASEIRLRTQAQWKMHSETQLFKGDISSKDKRLREQRDVIQQLNIEKEKWKKDYNQLAKRVESAQYFAKSTAE